MFGYEQTRYYVTLTFDIPVDFDKKLLEWSCDATGHISISYDNNSLITCDLLYPVRWKEIIWYVSSSYNKNYLIFEIPKINVDIWGGLDSQYKYPWKGRFYENYSEMPQEVIEKFRRDGAFSAMR